MIAFTLKERWESVNRESSKRRMMRVKAGKQEEEKEKKNEKYEEEKSLRKPCRVLDVE